MIIAATIVSALFALLLLVSGVMKVRLAPAVVANLTPLGVPERAIPRLGALEITATLGLFAGLVWWPLGAAAIGCILYFTGAVITHLRARDNSIAPAAVLLVASVTVLALILAAR